MRKIAVTLVSLMSVLVVACVTINVYFPAAAAEKAADRIIEEVWGEDSVPAEETEPAPTRKHQEIE